MAKEEKPSYRDYVALIRKNDGNTAAPEVVAYRQQFAVDKKFCERVSVIDSFFDNQDLFVEYINSSRYGDLHRILEGQYAVTLQVRGEEGVRGCVMVTMTQGEALNYALVAYGTIIRRGDSALDPESIRVLSCNPDKKELHILI